MTYELLQRKYNTLLDLCHQMRIQQKIFSKTRNSIYGDKAKLCERKIDELLKNEVQPEKQKGLF